MSPIHTESAFGDAIVAAMVERGRPLGAMSADDSLGVSACLLRAGAAVCLSDQPRLEATWSRRPTTAGCAAS